MIARPPAVALDLIMEPWEDPAALGQVDQRRTHAMRRSALRHTLYEMPASSWCHIRRATSAFCARGDFWHKTPTSFLARATWTKRSKSALFASKRASGLERQVRQPVPCGNGPSADAVQLRVSHLLLSIARPSAATREHLVVGQPPSPTDVREQLVATRACRRARPAPLSDARRGSPSVVRLAEVRRVRPQGAVRHHAADFSVAFPTCGSASRPLTTTMSLCDSASAVMFACSAGSGAARPWKRSPSTRYRWPPPRQGHRPARPSCGEHGAEFEILRAAYHADQHRRRWEVAADDRQLHVIIDTRSSLINPSRPTMAAAAEDDGPCGGVGRRIRIFVLAPNEITTLESPLAFEVHSASDVPSVCDRGGPKAL